MAVRQIDQFVGTLLGVMTGDALGRPAKDHSAEELIGHEAFGLEMIGGFYTEDTELMISVAESLLARREIDPDDLARRFSENLNPMRGYNPGELEVFYRLQQGLDWRDASRMVFASGSFGVGASCRAAPVGLYYYDDLDELVRAAALTARVTHTHPLGEAGAVTVALGVALGVARVTPRAAFDTICDRLAAAGYQEMLPFLAPVIDLLDRAPEPPEVVEVLGGSRLTVQCCIPAALYSVLRFPDNFQQAVTFAVRLGGDADTIAAITGAFAGAYHGVKAIPLRWVERLENQARGCDYVADLGSGLYRAWNERADAR